MAKQIVRSGTVIMAAFLAGVVLMPGSVRAQRVFIEPPVFSQHCNITDTLWIMLDEHLTGVEGVSLNIAFDQTIGRLDTILPAPALAANMFLAYQRHFPDSVTIDAGILTGSFSGPGAICGLVITLTDNLGLSPLTLVRSTVRDLNNQDIAHTTDSGQLDNPCCCRHHGDIVSDQIFNVSDIVELIQYTFNNGLTPPKDDGCPHTNRGDVNCDAIPNVLDVVRLINFVFLNGPLLCDPCTCNPYPTSCP